MDKQLAAEQIENGVEYLKEHDWCQKTLLNTSGAVCAIGSVIRSNGVSSYKDIKLTYIGLINPEIWENGLKALDIAAGGVYMTATFNDDEDRTKEEVIDFMIGVAKDLRNAA